jgi:transposase
LKQDDLDAGRRSDGLTTAESAEVAKLRKKVRELEIERDILKKAAWFARETDSVPAKSSNS